MANGKISTMELLTLTVSIVVTIGVASFAIVQNSDANTINSLRERMANYEMELVEHGEDIRGLEEVAPRVLMLESAVQQNTMSVVVFENELTHIRNKVDEIMDFLKERLP